MAIEFFVIVPLVVIVLMMTRQIMRASLRFTVREQIPSPVELPSVSVCIAARNETHALAECLQRVLASDYKKLEVIVYDDTSEDDTSMIVKSFAHLGVRFVEGETLPEGWLGRNYAFDTLAREASGTYVLMTNVDTYLQPTTISQLVNYMTAKNMDMISVIPGRSSVWRNSVLFGVLYYYWQLLLSSSRHPASSEALWMIRRRTLIDELGGLSFLKAKILIGLRVAQQLGTNRYHCVVNDDTLGVTWEKKLSTQRELTIRELYPLAGNTVWGALLAVIGLALMAWVPFGLIIALLSENYVVAVAYGAIELWLMALYGWYTVRAWARWAWLGGIVWPIVIIQELILMIVSIIRHLTRTVTWKGRSLYVK